MRYYIAEDTKINMCDYCKEKFAECEALGVEFGDGKGNDNVIKCGSFRSNLYCCTLAGLPITIGEIIPNSERVINAEQPKN